MLYTILGIVIPWLLVGVGIWLGYELIRLNGRVLLRLDSLDQRLTALASRAPSSAPAQPRPAELAIGTAAPEFDLPDLDGNRHTLAEYRGRRLLLIFFNPHCGFCTRMADALAELPPEGGAGLATPLLISTGAVDDNRAMVAEYGLRCPLLLQPQMEVATRFGVTGTPSGYLIDEQGAIASPSSVGADALLALVRPVAAKPEEPTPAALPSAPARPDSGALVAGDKASASNGRPACAKCKGAKKPCQRCSDLAEAANHKTNGVVPAPHEYELVELFAGASLEEMTRNLNHHAEQSRRLIVVTREPEQDTFSETETAALRKFLRTNSTWLVAHQSSTDGRFLVLSCDPRDRKALPSLLAQAGSFAKALATHIGGGAKKVTGAQLERRLEICTLCDRRTDDRCSACGCVLSTKASWRTSQCPLAKWPTLNENELIAAKDAQSSAVSS